MMKTAWRKQQIPAVWEQGIGVFITKEQHSNTISQFRGIALLNVEGNVAIKSLRVAHVQSQQVGRPSQQLHTEVVGPILLLLRC